MSRFVNPVPQYYLNDGSVASSGKLYFYENKDPNTKKDTFSDSGETIKNTNPVILDGEGRVPPTFGTGLYTVVLKSSQNVQQWSRDDVDLTGSLGQFSDWSPIVTYRVNDIVRGSDGKYYSSLISNNTANDPVSNPEDWEEIVFLTFWNENVTYSIDELVIYSGDIYSSLSNDNTGNQPDISLSEWSNLTSINSQSQTVEIQGDFTSEEFVTCTRIGDMVTISSSEPLTNVANFNPVSSTGVIPEQFRPQGDKTVLNSMIGAEIVMVKISEVGTLSVEYRNWNGDPSPGEGTVYPITITYMAAP